MSRNDATFRIGVAVQDAISNVNRFRNSANAAASRITKGFTSLRGVITVAAGALAARQIVRGIGTLVDAAKTQEDAVNSLNSALRTSGDFSEEASKDLQNFASGLQKVTKVGDETTLELLALAKSFGASNDQAKALVTASVDLSEATGISLNAAVKGLGQTLGGTSGSLARYLPQLRDLTKEQLASGEAIDFVATRFAGAATDALQTYSGATQQAKNTFGDLQEELGFLIIKNQEVIRSITGVNGFFGSLIDIIADNKEIVEDLVSTLAGFLVKGIALAAKSVETLTAVFVGSGLIYFETKKAVLEFVDAFFQFQPAQIVITAFGDTVNKFVQAFLLSIEGLLKGLSFIPGVGDTFDKAASSVSAFGKTIGNSLKIETKDFDKLSRGLRQTIKDTEDSQASFEKFGFQLGTVAEGIASAGDQLVASLDEGKKSADQTDRSIKSVNKSANVLSSTSKKTAQASNEVQSALKKQAQELEKIEQSVKDVGKSEIDVLKETRNARLALVDDVLSKQGIKEKEAASLREKIIQESEDKISGIQEKANVERINAQSNFLQRFENLKVTNPLDAIIADSKSKGQELMEGFEAGVISRSQFDGLNQAMTESFDKAVISAAREVNIVDRFKSLQKGDLDTGQFITASLPSLSEVGGSFANNIASGEEGGKQFAKDITTSFANSVFPGLGAIVGPLSELAELSPEEQKKQIEGFVDGAIAFINTIAENIDTIVEALIEVLIVDGGLNKIAVALAEGGVKATSGLIDGITKGLDKGVKAGGKNLEKSIGEPLRKGSDKLGGDIRSASDKFGSDFATQSENFKDKIDTGFTDGRDKITAGVNNTAEAISSKGSEVADRFRSGLDSGGQKLEAGASNIGDAAKKAGDDISEKFKKAFSGVSDVPDKIKSGIESALGSLGDIGEKIKTSVTDALKSIGGIFDGIGKTIKKAFSFDFSGIGKSVGDALDKVINVFKKPLNVVIDLLNKLKIPKLAASGKILGQSYNVTFLPEIDLIPGNIPRLQTGGTVPQGFENDTFPAFLSSGEIVVPKSDVIQLREFLDQKDLDRQIAVETLAAIKGGSSRTQSNQPIQVNLTLDGETLAEVLFDLNRRNERLRA